jgi:hypothetical protein
MASMLVNNRGDKGLHRAYARVPWADGEPLHQHTPWVMKVMAMVRRPRIDLSSAADHRARRHFTHEPRRQSIRSSSSPSCGAWA